jgi:hypothetical protein
MRGFHRAGASQQVATIVPAGSRHRATGRPVPGRPGRPPRWRPARPPAGPGRPGWPAGYSASWPGRAGSHPGGSWRPYAPLADVVRSRGLIPAAHGPPGTLIGGSGLGVGHPPYRRSESAPIRTASGMEGRPPDELAMPSRLAVSSAGSGAAGLRPTDEDRR